MRNVISTNSATMRANRMLTSTPNTLETITTPPPIGFKAKSATPVMTPEAPINTAIATNTGSYSGIGFAIPVNVAKWVTEQLIHKGTVARAYLGVGIKPVTPEMAQAFGENARK